MKSERVVAIMGCLTAGLAASHPTQAQRSGPIEFDAPGAITADSPYCTPQCGTIAYANNALGATVGFYTDANVVPHGFVRTPAGAFISFDAPEAGLAALANQGTVAYSINDLGVIAGQFQDSSNIFHGFIRHRDGTFSTFDAPGAGAGTVAFDINLEGATAGVYFDNVTGQEHGFVRSPGGDISPFDPPNSTSTMVCEETCLNIAGSVTGFYTDPSGVTHGFLRHSDGAITTIDAPAATTTICASINDEEEIAGYFIDANGIHGFVRSPSGSFDIFNVVSPTNGAVETAAFSINLFRAVAGEYLDANGVMHGFSRAPSGSIVLFDAAGAGSGAGQGTRPSTNNLEGEIAGWFVDGGDLNHGFLWRP